MTLRGSICGVGERVRAKASLGSSPRTDDAGGLSQEERVRCGVQLVLGRTIFKKP